MDFTYKEFVDMQDVRENERSALSGYLSKILDRERRMDEDGIALLKKFDEMDHQTEIMSIQVEKLKILKEQYFLALQQQFLNESHQTTKHVISDSVDKINKVGSFSFDINQAPNSQLPHYIISSEKDNRILSSEIREPISNFNPGEKVIFQNKPNFINETVSSEQAYLQNQQLKIFEAVPDGSTNSKRYPNNLTFPYNSSGHILHPTGVESEIELERFQGRVKEQTNSQSTPYKELDQDNFISSVSVSNIKDVDLSQCCETNTEQLCKTSLHRDAEGLLDCGKNSETIASIIQSDVHGNKLVFHEETNCVNHSSKDVDALDGSNISSNGLDLDESLKRRKIELQERINFSVHNSLNEAEQKCKNSDTLYDNENEDLLINKAAKSDAEMSNVTSVKKCDKIIAKVSDVSVLNESKNTPPQNKMKKKSPPEAENKQQISPKTENKQKNSPKTGAKQKSTSKTELEQKGPLKKEVKQRFESISSKIGSGIQLIEEDNYAFPKDDDDSFYESKTPLTTSAAYQSLIGAIPHPQQIKNAVDIEDSESEDDVEKAMAMAVCEKESTVKKIADSKAKQEAFSSVTVGHKKPSEDPKRKSISLTSNTLKNKLSKASRKALGLDSDSDEAPSIKPKEIPVEEDSDEFDFYD